MEFSSQATLEALILVQNKENKPRNTCFMLERNACISMKEFQPIRRLPWIWFLKLKF